MNTDHIRTIITNKRLSSHVDEFKRDEYKGKQWDTTLTLHGSVCVAGDTVQSFMTDLEKLIEQYKV